MDANAVRAAANALSANRDYPHALALFNTAFSPTIPVQNKEDMNRRLLAAIVKETEPLVRGGGILTALLPPLLFAILAISVITLELDLSDDCDMTNAEACDEIIKEG